MANERKIDIRFQHYLINVRYNRIIWRIENGSPSNNWIEFKVAYEFQSNQIKQIQRPDIPVIVSEHEKECSI